MSLTEKSYLKKYKIRPLIISRGRSSLITTNNLLPEYIEIVVPESEKDDYKKTVSNPIVTIPDSVEGLGNVRNYILDTFPERCIIMIDDDIKIVYSLTGQRTRRIDDKEEVLQILINTAVMAMDAGVHCFGFMQTDIRKYKGTEPFNLETWVGGVIGIIGRKYRFRKDYFKVDIDYCLQNLLVDRIIFQNSMYTFSQSRDNNVGGNSIYRTKEAFDESIETLKKKWGRYIKVSEYTNQKKIKLNVQRKQKGIQYE